MTTTLKPWTTVLLIATICVLAGFAVGQVTAANSAKDAGVSARTMAVKDKAVDKRLRQVVNQLKAVNNRLGGESYGSSIHDELENVATNTYWTCVESRSVGYCQR